MSTVIPAAPGWYVLETDDGDQTLDAVIAWKTATDEDGDDVLLPFVNAGPGAPPFALTPDSFKHLNRQVVYRPDHNPSDS
ncbi:hypothetical protein ACFV0H_07525 [Streptomyces erythrochromogenes]|uniref:hypothetical protein n=1 Tax=Streptomyces erythrochromogenes TaxID=285574 RepID=UPI00367A97CD